MIKIRKNNGEKQNGDHQSKADTDRGDAGHQPGERGDLPGLYREQGGGSGHGGR